VSVGGNFNAVASILYRRPVIVSVSHSGLNQYSATPSSGIPSACFAASGKRGKRKVIGRRSGQKRRTSRVSPPAGRSDMIWPLLLTVYCVLTVALLLRRRIPIADLLHRSKGGRSTPVMKAPRGLARPRASVPIQCSSSLCGRQLPRISGGGVLVRPHQQDAIVCSTSRRTTPPSCLWWPPRAAWVTWR